jgi:branched-chain amino acid transport system ATP-binding protein
MLKLVDAAARYGAIQALKKIDLHIDSREIVCLIGANGAGKSTVMNVISGLVPLSNGYVEFEGEKLSGRSATAIVNRGIVQVPEGRLVFPDMTVLENLEMGAFTRPKAEQKRTYDLVFTLFPRLAERRVQLAGLMSGGEQQMLAIGRALMASPRLLLLDEPSMGLAPLLIAEIFETLGRLRTEFGLTMLLVEQNAHAALSLADRGYVLANGAITRTAAASELLSDSSIQEAFLGKKVIGRP